MCPDTGRSQDAEAVDGYLGVLDSVEEAARVAVERGMSAEEAGEAYRLPAGSEEWTLFNSDYFARAIGAWMAELEA